MTGKVPGIQSGGSQNDHRQSANQNINGLGG
jgi:hypothetical protein